MQDIQQQIISELDKFEDLASEGRKKLLNTADSLEKGYSPSSSEINDISASLNGLRQLYERICATIASETPTPEISSRSLSAPELRKLAAGINESVERAREDLRQFMLIRSKDKAFSKYVEQIQEKAQKLLTRLEDTGISGGARKSALKDAEKYQMFLAMLDAELTGSNITNAEDMMKVFPPMAILGLTSHNYYIDNSKPEPEIPSEPVTSLEQPEVQLPDVPEAETVSTDPDEVICASTPLKYKKPGASTFTDEIIREAGKMGSEKIIAIREVINAFSRYGIMTLNQVAAFRIYHKAWYSKNDAERLKYLHEAINENSEEEIKNTLIILEWLERKKAAVFYPFGDENLYCLTVWAVECLGKQAVRKKFNGIPLGGFKFPGNKELQLSKVLPILRANDLILRYISSVSGDLSGEKYASLISGIKCGSGDVFIPVFWLGKEYKCLLVPSVREAVRLFTSKVMKNDVLAVTDETPEEVNDVLSGIDERLRERIFVLDEGLHRGFADTSPDFPPDDDGEGKPDYDTDDDQSSDDDEVLEFYLPPLPPESESQLGFNFDAEPEPEIAPEPEVETEIPPAEFLPGSEAEPLPPAELTPEPELEPEALPETAQIFPEEIPGDEEAVNDIRGLLVVPENSGGETPFASLTTALLAAKAMSLEPEHEKCGELFTRIDLATGIFPGTPAYTGAELMAAFQNSPAGDTVNEGLMLSAYLRAMISPEMPYSDFELKHKAEEIYGDYSSFFPSFHAARKVFAEIFTFYRRYSIFPAGFLESASSSGDETDSIARVRSDALGYLELPSFNKDMKILPFFTRELFGSTSEIYAFTKAVSDDDASMSEKVRDYVDKYYDPNEKVAAEKLRDLIDSTWSKIWRERSIMPGKPKPLISNLRTSVIRSAYIRLEAMQRWLTLSGGKQQSYDTEAFTAARNSILSAISEATPKSANLPGSSPLIMAMEHIRRKLNNEADPFPFSILLTNGIIPVDASGSPVLGSTEIKYYEPWRNVSRFRNEPKLSLKEAEDKILYDVNSPMFENLHQLELIRGLKGESFDLGDDAERARESAEKYAEDFRLEVMTHYAFGRISEDDTETFSAILQENEFIMDTGDFGCWRQFIAALRHQAKDIAEENKSRLIGAIKSRMESFSESPAELQEAMRLAEEGSLNAAESCVNAFESARASGQDVSVFHAEKKEIAAFRSFMEMFSALYNECDKTKNREKALKTFGRSYIEDNPPEEWPGLTRKLKDERTALLENWPSRLGNTSTEQVRSVINGLGFTVEAGEDAVRRENSRTGINNMEVFTVKMKKNDGRNCAHPIAKFGTKLEELSVFILYGSGTPGKIVSSIMELDPGTSIVLMDYHLNIPARNQFAKAFRTHGRQDKYFLLVDRVLALFIALQDMAGRLPVLLQCTLPYTSCSPFTKGSGYVAPEMFYGRERELADIRNPEGSSIVYGGRQLGKTSILKRAETLGHQPEKLRYAFYNDLSANGLKKSFEQGWDEGALVSSIINGVNAKTPGLLSTKSSTLQAVCDNIGSLISGKKADSFILLLDEADAFLAAIRDENYEPLRPLVNLRSNSENKFRFVLAGLHNVMRAKNSAADNNPLGQLGSALCIRPLSPYEARRLLLEPLEYLGFRIDPERHLETIIASTNYYPGVIQYFGYTLLEKFTERCDSSGAEELSPPFSVDDALLGSVIGSQELTGAATQTLRLSLGLDKYFMLGQCIAYLYYTGGGDSSGAFRGYSVNDIAGADSELTRCMAGEPYEAYDAILREMSDMGILSRLQNGNYRFRRQSFIKSVWPNEDAVLSTE